MAGSVMHAQDNAYKIDNECYDAFLSLSRIFDYDQLSGPLDEYYALCRSKNDLKAEILGDTQLFKSYIKSKSEEEVLLLRESLHEKIHESGFMQYYYYLDALLVTNYINRSKFGKALKVASEMEADATERNDSYGIFTSYKNLANIFLARRDFAIQRTYIKKALNYSDEVPDQSVCRLYVDLSNSYRESYKTDSSLVALTMAGENMKSPGDTVLVYGSLARHYGLARDWAQMDSFASLFRYYSGKYSTAYSSDVEKFLEVADFVRQQKKTSAVNAANEISDTSDRLLTKRYVALALGDMDEANVYADSLLRRWQAVAEGLHLDEVAEVTVQSGMNRLAGEMQKNDMRMLQLRRLSYYVGLVLLLMIIAFTSFSYYRQKQMNKELTKLKNQAEQANRMKTEFIQNMSHEIRTPLNAIVGFSQLLSLPDGFLTEEEKSSYSSYVTNNSNMLTMLIDDILNLSDVENGLYSMKMTHFHINSLCSMALKTVEYRVVPGVRLYFTTELTDNDLLYSDERRVQQVLVNFLSNACKHTERGEIHMHASLAGNPGMLSISVTDTGTGVPAGKEEEIFERFTKLDNYKQGTGLGLNICRIIADKLGGRVYLDKSYRNGARFIFEIPYSTDGHTV